MSTIKLSPAVDWDRFVERIRDSKRILLTAHVRPDGDCIGSEVAMLYALQALGKDVRIVNPHPVPPTLFCVDPQKDVRWIHDQQGEDADWIDGIDLFFVLDTSSWMQLGEMGEVLKRTKAKKIVLDHHAKGDDIGAEMFTDVTADATGSLVVQAIMALGIPLTKTMSDAAFAAIATDTGWFRFSSVTPETFRTVAELIAAGTVPADYYREIYEQESLGRIRLIGRTLSKAEASLNGSVMCTSVMRDDLKQAGALASDTEDIVNMLLQVKGSKVAVLISELKENSFKISFRSRCDVDCSQLATKFAGGGHKKAAGATVDKPFEETKQVVLNAIYEAIVASEFGNSSST